METINDAINQISQLGSKLNGLSGFSLTVLFCLLLGFVIKLIPTIPNSRIPTVIMFAGMLLGMLLADPRADELPFRVWLMKNAVIGGLAGGVAWFIHANRHKIPILKQIVGYFTEDQKKKKKEKP